VRQVPLERECERIGRDPNSIRRSAHIGLVNDEQELHQRFGGYEYSNVTGSVLFGSDAQVLDGVKALERAGADQVLFAGAIRHGTEQLERVAALLSIDAGCAHRAVLADARLCGAPPGAVARGGLGSVVVRAGEP